MEEPGHLLGGRDEVPDQLMKLRQMLFLSFLCCGLHVVVCGRHIILTKINQKEELRRANFTFERFSLLQSKPL